MIVVDASHIPMPGKQAEFVAVLREAVAYLDQRWPLSMPRMMTADMYDGRIHIINLWESLAARETGAAEMQDDAHYQALIQKGAPLVVPGSTHSTISRVL